MKHPPSSQKSKTTLGKANRMLCHFASALCMLFVIGLPGFLMAKGENELFSAANKLYSEEKFDSSIVLYEKILSTGVESSELFFNLGNSYFKIKNLPAAILNYERAAKLSPADEDIAFNLRLANSRTIDKIEPIPPLFYQLWFSRLSAWMTPDEWAAWATGCIWLSISLFILLQIASAKAIKKISLWSGFIFLFVSVTAFVFARKQYDVLSNRSEAIVFSPTVPVKSSPDEGGTDLFIIHEGTKVNRLDELGDWVKIRMADGSIGWMKKNSIEII